VKSCGTNGLCRAIGGLKKYKKTLKRQLTTAVGVVIMKGNHPGKNYMTLKKKERMKRKMPYGEFRKLKEGLMRNYRKRAW